MAEMRLVLAFEGVRPALPCQREKIDAAQRNFEFV
jgi:hypothetical protein